ncbi:hypothetical protein [Streptomyces prasinus]|uniref:hypothetical protein n=1 Tax=Streptomyces prasinus TaxID=67345 RepID=UPI00362B6407
MIDYDDSGRPAVQVGGLGPACLLLSEPTRPFEGEPTLDFLAWTPVCGQGRTHRPETVSTSAPTVLMALI